MAEQGAGDTDSRRDDSLGCHKKGRHGKQIRSGQVATLLEKSLHLVEKAVAVGFHPYFQLTDSPRDEWTIAIGAKTHWLFDSRKLPTGVTEPTERLLPPPRVGLRDYNLDEVFGDLVRDADGRATMTVWGRSQRLDVVVGPRYRAVVLWAPNPSGKGRGGQGDSPSADRNSAISVGIACRSANVQMRTIANSARARACML